MNIDDPWAAWCFDEAVYMWGSFVDEQVEGASQGAKDAGAIRANREGTLKRLLTPQQARTTNIEDDPEADVPHWADYGEDEPLPPLPPPKGQFRDPAELMKKQ